MALITLNYLASLLHSPKSLKIDFLFELQHPEGSGAACHGAGTPRGRLQPARSEPVLLAGIDCANYALVVYFLHLFIWNWIPALLFSLGADGVGVHLFWRVCIDRFLGVFFLLML